MSDLPKLRPATPACPGCDGRKFTLHREENALQSWFECKGCGRDVQAYEVRTTVLLAAKCKACEESFLFRRNVESIVPTSGPSYCRACQATGQANFYEKRARELRAQAITLRESQRRALARWKPPTSAAEMVERERASIRRRQR